MASDPRHRRQPWFIFGENPLTGEVDISDPDDDVLIRVPRSLAEQIVALRTAYLEWLERRVDS